jgi:hypothetical protein
MLLGFTPRVNRQFCPCWQHSSSSAISTLGTKLNCCQLGRPYLIHISKVPLIQAFVDPLWNFPFFKIDVITGFFLASTQMPPEAYIAM